MVLAGLDERGVLYSVGQKLMEQRVSTSQWIRCSSVVEQQPPKLSAGGSTPPFETKSSSLTRLHVKSV